MLQNEEADGVSLIIVVAGFSRCPLFRTTIEAAFSKQKIIIPYESELSILKGAVIFGHKPEIIAERVSKFTYGFSKRKKVDPKIHDKHHQVLVNGVEKCCRVFDPIIHKYERIPFGKKMCPLQKQNKVLVII